jgi:hypothetical protein
MDRSAHGLMRVMTKLVSAYPDAYIAMHHTIVQAQVPMLCSKSQAVKAQTRIPGHMVCASL